MFSDLIQNGSLPKEQLDWLIKFEPLLKLAQNYQEKYLIELLDQIEKEARLKGYKEIVELIL